MNYADLDIGATRIDSRLPVNDRLKTMLKKRRRSVFF